MWLLVTDLLLVFMGVGIGITLMCILQVSKRADETIEDMKRRNEE